MRKKSPLEILENVIGFSFVINAHPKIPGSVINKLPKSMREELANLTSDDMQYVRRDNIFDDLDTSNKKKFKQEMMEFDKKLKNE